MKKFTIYGKDRLPTFEGEAPRLIMEYFNSPKTWRRMSRVTPISYVGKTSIFAEKEFGC